MFEKKRRRQRDSKVRTKIFWFVFVGVFVTKPFNIFFPRLSCLLYFSCPSSQLLKLPFVKLSPTEHAVALSELSDAIGVIDVDQVEGKRMDDTVRLCMYHFLTWIFLFLTLFYLGTSCTRSK